MDHNTFIKGLARQLGRDTDATQAMTDTLTDAIKSVLCDLNSVAIPSFGRFEAIKNDEYVACDPTDNVTKLFPPRINVAFKCGTMLKKRLSHE